jgi:autotransporter-associated beta strand protein
MKQAVFRPIHVQSVKSLMKRYIYHYGVGSILAVSVLLFGSSLAAFGQLQWNSYDINGNLVTANVASGGDLASGTSVTFTIPANTQLSFVTKSFTPFSIANASTSKIVTFNVSASGGFGGVALRTMGWGLFNSAGTAGFSDDVGYYGLWNGAGPYLEPYSHAAGTANLFSGTKLGQGTANSGTPSNGVTYTNQIQLDMNSSASGISLGTSSSTLATAGVAMNGPSVTERIYTNPVQPLLGGVNTFDEFSFMFTNTTASSVTITLSAIALGNSLTWDASKANPTAPTDGSGFWSVTNSAWSSGGSDSVWSPGYNAVIGAGNGAAGIISNLDASGEVVSNITFNAPGSGAYNITGTPLILTGSPTITVASGVTATNSSQLGGTGFTKAGNGTLVLLPSVAATNIGLTMINAGTLLLQGSTVLDLNDSVTVNPGAVLLVGGSISINTSKTLTINGGVVTNLGLSGTSTETHNLVVFNNNGILAYGPAGSGQLVGTNFDFRGGFEAFPKFGAGQSTNFSVKSTSGTMVVQSRPNNTGVQGIILTLLGGIMIPDYPNPPPNGDSTAGGAKFLPTGPLTLGGGTLFCRFNAAASRTETVQSTIILPGATYFQATNNAANGNGAYAFTQNALNRSVGGTIDYSVGGTSTGTHNITTSSANVNGILGGWATFEEGDWATNAASAIAAYGAYNANTSPTAWGTADNVVLSGNPSSDVPALTTINTLKLNGSAAITLDGTLTLAAGGLLVTGSGANSISGGTLEGASGADLIIHQYSSGSLTIGSALADNGTPTSLTESGTGELILTGTDSMTGTNYLNGGILEVTALAQLAAGPIVLNNGTLLYSGSGETCTRPIVLTGVGGTINVAGGVTITQAAPVVSGGGANSAINGIPLNLGDWGGLTMSGSGTLVLATNNVYNGPTIVNGGVLLIDGTNSLTGTSGGTHYSGGGTVTVNGGTLGGTGMVNGAADVKNGATIAPGNSTGTLTLGSGLTLENGSTSVFQITSGVTASSLSVQGNLVVSNGTVVINVTGSTLQPMTNTLITYTGTLAGSFNPTVGITGGSVNGSISIDTSTPGEVNLDVVPQVVITSQPADLIVSTNSPATFNVTATGSSPLNYQWYYYGSSTNNTPMAEAGATNSTFTITNAQSTDTGLYSVVVSNSYNAVMSRFATLIVGNVAPVLNGPFNETVIQGNSVTFSASVVIANPPPTFQWQTNSVNVDGATSLSLTLNNVQFSLNNATVSLIASNAAAMVTNSATLTVLEPPAITPQPTSTTVNVGATATFVSGASGVPTPTLQWYENGKILAGQTSGTLTILNAQGSNIGNYDLVAANAAGSVTSSIVMLSVNSTTLSAVSFSPTNGATGICYDTPLYITFGGPVSTVNSGSVRIYNINNPATPVDTINVSTNLVIVSSGINITNNVQAHSPFSGDPQVINYYPVIVSGNTAAIYPHGGVLTSNQTYYVTMDNGIVADSSGAYFAGISATNVWQFTTKAGGPANPTNIVVAADGSGDFVTVQGSIDSITPGNTTPTTININNGHYVELVDISSKSNLTLVGQSRPGTVVGYQNNNNLTGTTAGRMAFKVNAGGITLKNLTITNSTPQGGSQAESLLIYNSGTQCIVDNCEIDSRQDTVLINANTSQGYFNNCKITGNFDYIWGVGVGYFNDCVFHTITNNTSSSYNLTAARTATSSSLSATTPWVNPNGTTYSAYGFTFVDCTFEADTGITGITLADANGTAGGLDAWINCYMDTNAYVSPSTTLSNTYVFWQYNNTNIPATIPISFTNVQTIGVTNNDSRLLAATNVVTWFSGWLPQLFPYIFSQPANLSVGAGQNATFIVGASGIPDPTFQWLLNGTNLIGQTASTLTIPGASALNIGTYSVIVTNNLGGVISSNITLAVSPPTTSSTIASPAVSGGNVQFTITGAPGSAGFGYRVWASTNLTLAPVTSTWTLLTNSVFGTGPIIFTDPSASGLPQRFYIITVP